MPPQLFDELTFTFSFNWGFALTWPSGLSLPNQLPLIISSALLSIQYAEKAFKWAYRKQKWEAWGEKKIADDSFNNKMKILLEALFLFPARATASARRRYNLSRKRRLEVEVEKMGEVSPISTNRVRTKNGLEKEIAKRETGHVDTAFLEDYVENNPGMTKLDLSGCYNLGEQLSDCYKSKLLSSLVVCLLWYV